MGSILGTYTMGLIKGLLAYLIGKVFREELVYARFMVFEIRKLPGEKGSVHLVPFDFSCMIQMHGGNDISKKKDYIHLAVQEGVILLVCIILGWVFIAPNLYSWTPKSNFLLGIGAGVVGSGITRMSRLIRILRQGEVREIVQSKIKMMLAGYSYGDLNLRIEDFQRPDDVNPEKDVQNVFRLHGCILYFYQEYYLGNIEGMHRAMEETERNITQYYIRQQAPAYETLIYYYSYIAYNPQKANYYYERVKGDFMQDKDANGLRIMAYYQYAVCGDIPQVQACINEAKKALCDPKKMKFFSAAEKDMEEKLLWELEEKMLRAGVSS